HVALQSIDDLLPSLSSKYALLCIGDDRPTKQCDWEYDSYCVVAVIGLSGDGPRCVSITHDNSNLNPKLTTLGYFEESIKANKFVNAGTVDYFEQDSNNNYFSGHQNWLSGQHMHEFLQQLNKHDDTLEHCIVDRSGKSTTAKWEF
ncbi:MAG: hypothetical protein VYC12_02760, partial [Candidatus Thermoplasmatota archaeon]|nr:hypothetical protein [Candidatus Thermoplasmatota archaeon]